MADGTKPCKNGHPYDRMPSGNCRPCDRAKKAARRERSRATRVRPPTRKCGHPWEDRYGHGSKNDCGMCARARAKRNADAKRGGPPPVPDPVKRPCGHPRTDQRPRRPEDCGTCHRTSQKRRYHADPDTHRAKARAHHKTSPEVMRANKRAFRARNPGYDDARKYAPDDDTRAWLTIIRRDPCSYCGVPFQTVDHIKPLSRGGANHWTNFGPACRACNSSKKDRELLRWLLQRC